MEVSLVTGLTAILVLYIFITLLRNRRNMLRLPPGPFQIPVFGTLDLFLACLRQEPPEETFRKWKHTYGPVISIKFGQVTQVIVNDEKLVEGVLFGSEWEDRSIDTMASMLDRPHGMNIGIFFASGESWKEMRRFSIRTLREFGLGKDLSQDALMEEELIEMKSKISDCIQNRNGIVDMQLLFTLPILNVIWSMVAGKRFTREDQKVRVHLERIFKAVQDFAVRGEIIMAFPFLRHILACIPTYFRDRRQMITDLQKSFEEIFAERRRLGNYRSGGAMDYIDAFLFEIENSQNNPKTAQFFTIQQLHAVLIDFFIAGVATSANTSQFAILYMIMYPDVQRKIQNEIDLVLGRDSLPKASDRSNMPYTEATITEILRLANVIPIIPRAPIKNIKIADYDIPKGTLTLLNIVGYHEHPSIFPEPLQFKPERFLDVSGKKLQKTDKVIAFGKGKRACLGEVLARATIFNFFVTLLQSYTFEASPDHPKPILNDPRLGTIHAPKPYYALVKCRSK